MVNRSRPMIPAAPEPSPKTALRGDAVGFDFNAFDAEAAKRTVQLQADLEVVTNEVKYGSFSSVPHELVENNYHFVRCGLKGDPAAEERAARLCQQGFVRAPSCVRAVGHEREGDRTLIVCCRPEAHALRLAEKVAKAQVRRNRMNSSKVAEIEQRLRDQLPSGTDLHMATRFGTTALAGGAGLAKFEGDLQAAARDLPKRK